MSDQIWFTTGQAAVHVRKNVQTVRKALESGDLCGGQRRRGGVPVKNGRWSVHIDCLDSWVEGRDCSRHAGERRSA